MVLTPENRIVILGIVGGAAVVAILFSFLIVPQLLPKSYPHWDTLKDAIQVWKEEPLEKPSAEPIGPIPYPQLAGSTPPLTKPSTKGRYIAKPSKPRRLCNWNRRPEKPEVYNRETALASAKKHIADLLNPQPSEPEEKEPTSNFSLYKADYHANPTMKFADLDLAFEDLESNHVYALPEKTVDGDLYRLSQATPYYRIQIGPIPNKDELMNIRDRLWNYGIRSSVCADDKFLLSLERYDASQLPKLRGQLSAVTHDFQIKHVAN